MVALIMLVIMAMVAMFCCLAGGNKDNYGKKDR